MFSIFRDADQLQNVEDQINEMLGSARRMFDLACGALLMDESPSEVSEELWSLDKELNRTERSIRRELLIHGTVRGAEVDQGLMLVYMSITKDIERIGDYCKNIFDLANLGVDLRSGPDADGLRQHTKEVADLLTEGSDAFINQDADAVHQLIPKIRALEAHFDAHVDTNLQSEKPGYVAAPRALLFRHLKRIASHSSNVLSSVVMPVDRLDFYKKSKAVEGPS
jgi:phosphate uptake regulator